MFLLRQIIAESCDVKYCSNSGVCEESKGVKTCECVEGFSGLECEVVRNFCEDAKCSSDSNCM